MTLGANSYRTERLEKIIARASSLLDMNQHGSSFSPFPATEALDLAWAVCELSKRHDGPGMRWRDTKVTVPCDGDNVLGYWCPAVPGGNTDCDVVHYYSGRWHEPADDEDDFRAPDFWMPLPEVPSPATHETQEKT